MKVDALNPGTSQAHLPYDLEQEIRAVEQLLGIRVVLWDFTGRLHLLLPADPVISRRRMFHRPHTLCGLGFSQRCVEHCGGALLEVARAAIPGQALEHTCWKGLRELITPVRVAGSVAAVLYAGVWQAPGAAPTGEQLPQAWWDAYRELSTLENPREDQLRRALQLLADAVAHRLVALEATGAGESRAQAIMHFTRANSARPIGIRDLAAHVGLSPSRASHLVRELFGMPFEQLVRRERIARAQHLLRMSDATVAQVGLWVGYADEYYFNRIFRKVTGISPGQYRRAQDFRG